MMHLLVVPFVLPLLLGAVLGWISDERIALQRLLSLAGSACLLLVALALLQQSASGVVSVYSLGNWQAPFGIVLVLDRLSALLVLVTAVLALLVNCYASGGDDQLGRNFHALFQFQLAGINGAFLTGDLFNLFVCFEILLIASYALLLHGQTTHRLRSALHYVILNLVGSALFLLGAGLFYGVAGTLNMADLARFVAQAQGDQLILLQVAGWALLLVFGLKAAFLPLHFWLPRAYASAAAPVAALFAIMTKVGLYAILRMSSLLFAPDTEAGTSMGLELLFVLGLLTMLLGALGAFAAGTLHAMLAYLVLVSVGMLLAAFTLMTEQALSVGLYYLLHSTLVIAGMFLLADLIARQRGKLQTILRSGRQLQNPNVLGALFFAGAIAVAGLPPFSGFLGKLGLLQAVSGASAWLLWPVVLLSGLVVILALSRAGSLLFWHASGSVEQATQSGRTGYVAAGLLLSSALLLVVFADPVLEFCLAAAQQLLQPQLYMQQLQGGW